MGWTGHLQDGQGLTAAAEPWQSRCLRRGWELSPKAPKRLWCTSSFGEVGKMEAESCCALELQLSEGKYHLQQLKSNRNGNWCDFHVQINPLISFCIIVLLQRDYALLKLQISSRLDNFSELLADSIVVYNNYSSWSSYFAQLLLV